MKKTLFTIASFLLLPSLVGAIDNTSFGRIADVFVPEYPVSRIAEVSVPEEIISDSYVIIDTEGNLVHGEHRRQKMSNQETSFVITNKSEFELTNISALGDNDPDTYVDFPYQGFQDRIKKSETAVLRLVYDQSIRTDEFFLSLSRNITDFYAVSIAAVGVDGTLTPLLSTKLAHAGVIKIPETEAREFEVTIEYIDVFRINELRFLEINKEQKQNYTLRFLAEPTNSYKLYYDATDDYRPSKNYLETPRLWSTDDVLEANLGQTATNDLFLANDSDKDGIPDMQDNCISVANPYQKDIDQNQIGDACEDFDFDGVMNYIDNCPSNPNQNQRDRDADGLGDICDDQESRLLARYEWLPMVVLAIVTGIVGVLMVRVLKN